MAKKPKVMVEEVEIEFEKPKKSRKKPKMAKKGRAKVEKVMHEYAQGDLHSGSKNGPKVKSRKQAVAIALSEARKAKKKGKKKK